MLRRRHKYVVNLAHMFALYMFVCLYYAYIYIYITLYIYILYLDIFMHYIHILYRLYSNIQLGAKHPIYSWLNELR